MNQTNLEINIATLLFQYELQVIKRFEGSTTATVQDRLKNDPIFYTTVHSMVAQINQKDNLIDIYQHLSGEENLQVLCKMNITFQYSEKLKVALIREGRNSIDFYPTTNKWKDNNDGNKMHHGNAHLLIKDGMDF